MQFHGALYWSISYCDGTSHLLSLFTSLPVCVHKGFDLWWTGCQTKGHQHSYLQTALSPVLTAHHLCSLTAVSDSVSLFACPLFLVGTSPFLRYVCLHVHTTPPLLTSNYCYLSYFFLNERLLCCQADIVEAGEGGRKLGEKGNVSVVDEYRVKRQGWRWRRKWEPLVMRCM